MPQLETGECFFIAAQTGCTCCSDENRLLGPLETLDDARAKAIKMHDSRYIASQYAKNGVYSIAKATYEKLPDGRLILGKRYIHDDGFGAFELDHPDHIPIELEYLQGETLR